MSGGVLGGINCRLAPAMKGENRPRMLLYLLVGALLLSTVLNFYFLLRLDARLVNQALESQLLDPAIIPQQPVPLQSPDKSPDKLPDNQPAPADTLLLVQP